MAEPTSVLSFSDLIINVAHKLGIAYYGSDGTAAAQVPTDAHDLDLCKRVINDAIRMFIHDAPKPNGWRWLRPVASLVLWPSIATNTSNKVTTAVFASSATTVTIQSAAFYPSMERKSLVITDVGTFTISSYTSSTVVVVEGNASAAHNASKTWSITADGNYTLPLDFGGQLLGHPTFAAGTNRGSSLEFVDESMIRERRANADSETGTPYVMAIRVMDNGSPRHRWEALFHRTPNEVYTVLFPYMLHFDKLVNTTDVSPAPFGHDETIKAACRAVAERDVEDVLGREWTYYREIALPNSYRVDASSAPRKLGYFGNGERVPASIHTFRDLMYQRPTLTVNS